MNIKQFFEEIKCNFEQKTTISASKVNDFFLHEFGKLVKGNDANASITMTRATVLFEGFYRYLPDSDLKKSLASVRATRWERHFGTPTVPFLLSYKGLIDNTKQFFDQFDNHSFTNDPWRIAVDKHFVTDSVNNVVVDPKSISRVVSPPSLEVTCTFTKTHNPSGGFTTTPCDPVSQRFIKHAANAAQTGGKVLEIGAAFGAATLEAIAKGATVFCNDIDPENLAVVRKRYVQGTQNNN